MAEVDDDQTLRMVPDADSNEWRFCRRLATPEAPLLPHELTEWERTALGVFALAEPELLQIAANIALAAMRNRIRYLESGTIGVIDQMALLCCDECLESVLFDVDGAAYQWPPRPHECGLMRVPLRRLFQ
jgi:hypothetical protein